MTLVIYEVMATNQRPSIKALSLHNKLNFLGSQNTKYPSKIASTIFLLLGLQDFRCDVQVFTIYINFYINLLTLNHLDSYKNKFFNIDEYFILFFFNSYWSKNIKLHTHQSISL